MAVRITWTLKILSIFLEKNMAFVNEYISSQDSATYRIKEIDKSYVVGGTSSDQWTIDRERNIYLRQVANGPHEIEYFHKGIWTLWFDGELIEIGIDGLSTTGGLTGPSTSHKAIRYIDLPKRLEARREEIIEVLREALTVYKNGGVYASPFPFSLTLDV